MTKNDFFLSAPAYGDYWVLDTDYTNYTVIYSCGPFLGLAKVEFAWILSRQRTLDDVTKDKLFNMMKSYKINTDILSKEDQTNCWVVFFEDCYCAIVFQMISCCY